MRLDLLAYKLGASPLTGEHSPDITGVTYDSRKVEPGSIFAAVRGFRDDGRRYIGQAVAAGAAAVLTDEPLPENPGVPVLRVDNVRRSMTLAAAEIYGRPADKLILIGITGTKGKTTTAYLLESILNQAGCPTGLMGTILTRYPGVARAAEITTPEGPDLQKNLAEMVQAGVTHVVFEVSSHALDLDRVAGCSFDVAVFTNLGHEHLDYHRNLAAYFEAKKRLFTEYLTGAHLMAGPGAVINADDEWGRKLIPALASKALIYGRASRADIRAEEIENGRSRRTGMSVKLTTPAGETRFRSNLLGSLNLDNFMAAAGAAQVLGISLQDISAGLQALPQVPGRLERVGENEKFLVLVDYAHTAESMAGSLASVRKLDPRKLITVFGCGGDRDQSKRPLMGRAAGELSDLTIVTSDNPRTEDPMEIIRQIEPGLKALNLRRLTASEFNGTPAYTVAPDRREAIGLGVRLMAPGDILVVTGKGHEDYQIIGREKIHFDDREEIRNALKREGKS